MIAFRFFYRSVPAKFDWKEQLCLFKGYFLFGFIPLYVVQVEFPT